MCLVVSSSTSPSTGGWVIFHLFHFPLRQDGIQNVRRKVIPRVLNSMLVDREPTGPGQIPAVENRPTCDDDCFYSLDRFGLPNMCLCSFSMLPGSSHGKAPMASSLAGAGATAMQAGLLIAGRQNSSSSRRARGGTAGKRSVSATQRNGRRGPLSIPHHCEATWKWHGKRCGGCSAPIVVLRQGRASPSRSKPAHFLAWADLSRLGVKGWSRVSSSACFRPSIASIVPHCRHSARGPS